MSNFEANSESTKTSMYRTRSVILFGIITLLTYLVSCGNRSIIWKPNKPLTWANFTHVDTIGDSTAAMSAVKCYYEYSSSSSYISNTIPEQYYSQFTLHVYAEFFPEESMVKKSCVTAYILAHEQMHFNISEIYARKMRCAIVNKPGELWTHEHFKTLYDSISECEKVENDLYDKETDNGRNPTNQRRWNTIILAQLDSLKSFEKRKIKLYRSGNRKTVIYNGVKKTGYPVDAHL